MAKFVQFFNSLPFRLWKYRQVSQTFFLSQDWWYVWLSWWTISQVNGSLRKLTGRRHTQVEFVRTTSRVVKRNCVGFGSKFPVIQVEAKSLCSLRDVECTQRLFTVIWIRKQEMKEKGKNVLKLRRKKPIIELRQPAFVKLDRHKAYKPLHIT